MAAANFGDLQQERFGQDLVTAAGFTPVTMKDLKDVYKRYEAVGVKVGRVKGKTDTQLYKQATKDVVAWWHHNKTQEEKAAAAAKVQKKLEENQAAAAKKKAAEQAAAQAAAQKKATAAAAQQKAKTLPNTAMAPPSSPTAAKQAATIQKGKAVVDLRVTTAEYRTILMRYGLSGYVPPSWALKDLATFNAWLSKEVRKRQAAKQAVVVAKSTPRIVSGATMAKRTAAASKVYMPKTGYTIPKVVAPKPSPYVVPQYKTVPGTGGARLI